MSKCKRLNAIVTTDNEKPLLITKFKIKKNLLIKPPMLNPPAGKAASNDYTLQKRALNCSVSVLLLCLYYILPRIIF